MKIFKISYLFILIEIILLILFGISLAQEKNWAALLIIMSFLQNLRLIFPAPKCKECGAIYNSRDIFCANCGIPHKYHNQAKKKTVDMYLKKTLYPPLAVAFLFMATLPALMVISIFLPINGITSMYFIFGYIALSIIVFFIAYWKKSRCPNCLHQLPLDLSTQSSPNYCKHCGVHIAYVEHT